MKNRKRMNFLGHAARTRVEKKIKRKRKKNRKRMNFLGHAARTSVTGEWKKRKRKENEKEERTEKE